jgi:hypothetical protein
LQQKKEKKRPEKERLLRANLFFKRNDFHKNSCQDYVRENTRVRTLHLYKISIVPEINDAAANE